MKIVWIQQASNKPQIDVNFINSFQTINEFLQLTYCYNITAGASWSLIDLIQQFDFN